MVVVTKSKGEQKDLHKCRSCLGTDIVSHPFLCKIAQLYTAFEVVKYIRNIKSEEKKTPTVFEEHLELV